MTSTNYWYYAQGIDTIGYCTGKDEMVQIMKRTWNTAALGKKGHSE